MIVLAWESLAFTKNVDEHASRQLQKRRAIRGTQLLLL